MERMSDWGLGQESTCNNNFKFSYLILIQNYIVSRKYSYCFSIDDCQTEILDSAIVFSLLGLSGSGRNRNNGQHYISRSFGTECNFV